jgi:hypothetical protein
MIVEIKIDFTDKDLNEVQKAGSKMEYSKERAEYLQGKGFVKIIEEKEEPVIEKETKIKTKKNVVK